MISWSNARSHLNVFSKKTLNIFYIETNHLHVHAQWLEKKKIVITTQKIEHTHSRNMGQQSVWKGQMIPEPECDGNSAGILHTWYHLNSK